MIANMKVIFHLLMKPPATMYDQKKKKKILNKFDFFLEDLWTKIGREQVFCFYILRCTFSFLKRRPTFNTSVRRVQNRNNVTENQEKENKQIQTI